MREKGTEFKGLLGGRHYVRFAEFFGMKKDFYRKSLGSITLAAGMKAVDLGCGPGALSFALAERAHPTASIVGVDISDDQLSYAREQASSFQCTLEFLKCSMDELPFPDKHCDLIMTSMALHETPPEVRRGAISEAARVLRDGGRFLLVDWSRPKWGLWGAVWFPFCCWGERNKDNWNNVYPELCRERGLFLKEDAYVNSIARRQVFRKRMY